MKVTCKFCGNTWLRFWDRLFSCTRCGAWSRNGDIWERNFDETYPKSFNGLARELIDVIANKVKIQSSHALPPANELFRTPEKIPSYMLFYCSICGDCKHLNCKVVEWKKLRVCKNCFEEGFDMFKFTMEMLTRKQ